MNPDSYQRVREIYHAACGLSTGQRGKLVRRLCGRDAALLGEVQSLLRHHEDQVDSLRESPWNIRNQLLANSADGLNQAVKEDWLKMIPESIGNYRILRLIGEGGMGIVFEAEQENPNRRVAVKILRLGFGTEKLFRRFQHEAEMLGRLRHVGIAHIYEAGIHQQASGAPIPFLAMELIDGLPLPEYARQRGLGVRERLGLLAAVCDAIEHAHQNGVIHRDLKPANVLVDAAGQPKVLDFGIARATDADVRMTTMQTVPGQLIGTIPYMSPEQASGDPAALDTRSDVYSLGVILYELLTGHLPYDFLNRSVADAVRLIHDTEPTRISSRDSAFRGDIDTLLAKALEKDKTRRYHSAAELGSDIRRYLAHQPLVARPASSMYLLRKFARRNRFLVSAAAICLILLIAGTTGTTIGLISATKANRQLADAVVEVATQRDRARESEIKANTELARSQLVVRFMRSMLRSVHPSVARDLDTALLRQILENAVEKLDSGEVAGEPAVEAEMRSTIADTYMGIGDNVAALRVIEPAIRLAHAAPSSEAVSFRIARIFYATTLVVWGRDAEARAEFEQCMAIQDSGFAPEDETAAVLCSNYGGLLGTLGEAERAMDLHRRALEIRRRVHGDAQENTAASMGNIAGCLKDLKRYHESLAMMQDVLTVYREADPPRWLHLTIAQNNTADLLLLMNRPAEAETLTRDALEICARIYQPDHQQIGILHHTLGRALRAQSRHQEAIRHFTNAAQILTSAFDEHHVFVAIARMDLGTELTAIGHYADAERELLTAYGRFRVLGAQSNDEAAECARSIANLYGAWNQANPGMEYATPVAEWDTKLTETGPRTP